MTTESVEFVQVTMPIIRERHACYVRMGEMLGVPAEVCMSLILSLSHIPPDLDARSPAELRQMRASAQGYYKMLREEA